MQDIYEF